MPAVLTEFAMTTAVLLVCIAFVLVMTVQVTRTMVESMRLRSAIADAEAELESMMLRRELTERFRAEVAIAARRAQYIDFMDHPVWRS